MTWQPDYPQTTDRQGYYSYVQHFIAQVWSVLGFTSLESFNSMNPAPQSQLANLKIHFWFKPP